MDVHTKPCTCGALMTRSGPYVYCEHCDGVACTTRCPRCTAYSVGYSRRIPA